MKSESNFVIPESFCRGSIVALTSDASIDFTPTDFDSPLSESQRSYLRQQMGVEISQVFWRKQIHGDDILVVSKSHVIPAKVGIFNEVYKSCPDADAYITNEKNLPIAIRTADCVPVFVSDTVNHAIGLAHAGWRGTYKTIASKTVLKMQEKYSSRPEDLKVILGPSIRQCCYQVGEEFRDYFPAYVKDRGGYLYVDVVAANRDQLIQTGVLKENIIDSDICTCCNKNYFSYRRDGAKSGRMISLMMLV